MCACVCLCGRARGVRPCVKYQISHGVCGTVTCMRHEGIFEEVVLHVGEVVGCFWRAEEREGQRVRPGHPAVLAVVEDGHSPVRF